MEKKILVSCSAFLENEKKQFLFLKRSENSSWGKNQWQLPEGKMEWGETPEQTIKREVFEEISCKIKEIEYIGFQTVNIKTPNTDYHVLSLIFKAKIDNKEIKLSDEHNAFEWLEKKQIEKTELRQGLKEFIMSNYYGKK